MRGGPERLLVNHFKVGLDWMLHQACAYWGLPHQLGEWYQVVVEIDAELQECQPKGEFGVGPWRVRERLPITYRVAPIPMAGFQEGIDRPSIKCFWCGQPGLRMAECPASTPQVEVGPPRLSQVKWTCLKTLKKSRATAQAVEVSPSPTREGDRTAAGKYQPSYDSDNGDGA